MFLAAECAKLAIKLPESGRYAVGMVFLPTEEESRWDAKSFEEIVWEEGQSVLGWRTCRQTTPRLVFHRAGL